jgi:hypothetical protein
MGRRRNGPAVEKEKEGGEVGRGLGLGLDRFVFFFFSNLFKLSN